MLSRLTIRNFAIIDQLTMNFSPELNMITGETGAGKSILVGALSLLLGQRADTKSLFNQDKKCVIEGVFQLAGYNLQDFFAQNDLDYENETILRREIGIEGKSRAFINDSPVNLYILKELGYLLVDIHSQHETLDINTETFQVRIVDLVADQTDDLIAYKKDLLVFRKAEKDISDLITELELARSESDYLRFQFEEIAAAELSDPNEQEELEQEQKELTHAEEIKAGLETSAYLIDEIETSALQRLKDSIAGLTSIEKYYQPAVELVLRMKSCQIELKDLAAELADLSGNVQVDNERLLIIQDRLNSFYKLSQKHRVQDLSGLIELRDRLAKSLNAVENSDETITKLQLEQTLRKTKLTKLAKAISQGRKKAIPKMELEIRTLLIELGIADAQFTIDQQTDEASLGTYGIDNIRFLFSANKGFKVAELSKIASGGELSRLMLSIKTLSSRYAAMPTIIFDEIDTGVSGEVALKVGRVMERLSKTNQVIAITHLPQIASRGLDHYFVYKSSEKGSTTTTNIRKLADSEREFEIAKMLSGNEPGEFALKNARELLQKE